MSVRRRQNAASSESAPSPGAPTQGRSPRSPVPPPLKNTKNGTGAPHNNGQSSSSSPPPGERSGRGIGSESLVRLLDSEYCDAWMCIFYMEKYRTRMDIVELCCNRLADFSVDEVEFFLPQLCNSALFHMPDNSALDFYLMRASALSIHFALLLCWLLDSAAADNNPRTHSRALRLRELVESAAINRETPGTVTSGRAKPTKRQPSSPGVEDIEAFRTRLIAAAAEKQRRCQFFNDELGFVHKLCAESLKLRQFQPVKLRKQRLWTDLQALDAYVQNKTVYFPLCTSASGFQRLARITPNEGIVLNSRERAPYLMFVELANSSSTCADPDLSLLSCEPQDSDDDDESEDEEEDPLPAVIDASPRGPSRGTPGSPRGFAKQFAQMNDTYYGDLVTEDAKILESEALDAKMLASSVPTPRHFPTPRRTPLSMPNAPRLPFGALVPNMNEEEPGVGISSARGYGRPSPLIPKLALDNCTPKTGRAKRFEQNGSSHQNDDKTHLTDVWTAASSPGTNQGSPVGSSTPHSPLRLVSPGIQPTLDFAAARAAGLGTRPTPLPPPGTEGGGEQSPEQAAEAARFAAYGELYADRRRRVAKVSPGYEKFRKNWTLHSYIVKAGDDIRQEQLAMQFIKSFCAIWTSANLPLWVRPYEVIVTGNNCGIIETVLDATSIDGFKKASPECISLLQCFLKAYGDETTPTFQLARRNFVESMAGYSVVMYLLQIKDRHNGNILMTKEGHVVHIDFGFMLSNSPGGMNFEGTHFKLTAEYVEVMGGVDSDEFQYFKVLVYLGFLEARKHMDKIVSLAEMMLPGENFPCFAGDALASIRDLRSRFQRHLSDTELAAWVAALVQTSVDNFRTRQYDKFQRLTNNIR